MLAYTFAKGLFDEIGKESGKKSDKEGTLKNEANPIFYFYSAMDFLVTESVFLVLLSALVSVTIFMSLPNSKCHKIEICNKISSIFLTIWFFFYWIFAVIYSFYKLIKVYAKKLDLWPDWWRYSILVHSIISIYTACCICISLRIYKNPFPLIYYKWIISITTVLLVFFACSWIIPSFHYTPLWLLRKNLSAKLKNKKKTNNGSTTIS